MFNTRITAITTFIIVFLSCAASAQSVEEIESIFRWFPNGYYYELQHTEWSEIVKSKDIETYSLYLGGGDKKAFPLPERFSESIVSTTRAVRYQIEPDSLLESQGEYTEEKENVIYSSDASELRVYTVDNMTQLVAESLKSGEFSDSGIKISGKPVYTLNTKQLSKNPKSRKHFIYLTDSQEILIANSARMIRKMCSAGNGLQLGFLDEDDYRDLVSLISEFGLHWKVTFFNTEIRKWHDYAIKKLIDDEAIDRMEERFEKSPMYVIKTYVIDKYMIQREIAYYEDSSAAKADPSGIIFKRLVSPRAPDKTRKFENLLEEKGKITVDGNLLIKDIIYDEEMMTAMLESNRAQMDFYRTLEEKKAEEQALKDK